ncbi:hypothetical protein [Cellulomonas endophytica]|uniref:hypothetical protein n=1 Tax=Cellulomonas endophytica TaxID=2494735 RepID=UPI001010E37A|nr:hypothetical protein [Cellulomonas endophytica]
MTLLLTVTLLALGLAGLLILHAALVALVPRPRATVAVALAVYGLLLAGLWLVLTYQSAVAADASNGRGDVFDEVPWLAAAAALAALSLRASRARRDAA